MKRFYYIVIIILSLFLSGCVSEKKESDTTIKSPRFSGYYTVTSMNDKEPLKKNITFNIDSQKRRISGFSGCNSYNAEFTLSKNKLNIVSPLSTKKACPPEIMKVEKTFFENLVKTNRYTISKGKLLLYNNDQIIIEAIHTNL